MRFFKSLGKAIRLGRYWWLYPALVGATAYGDIVNIGKYEPYQYVILNAVEIFLIFVGVNIGYWLAVFEISENRRYAQKDKEEKK